MLLCKLRVSKHLPVAYLQRVVLVLHLFWLQRLLQYLLALVVYTWVYTICCTLLIGVSLSEPHTSRKAVTVYIIRV